jgi:hypothetical protein
MAVPSRTEALEGLLNGSDPWLQACAVWWLGEHPEPALDGAVTELTRSDDAIVAETARSVVGTTA